MSQSEIELHSIEPKRNRFRFYRLAVWPDLFGGFTVMREWGRLAQPGTMRLDSYATEAEAGRALDRLRDSKKQRGYQHYLPEVLENAGRQGGTR